MSKKHMTKAQVNQFQHLFKRRVRELFGMSKEELDAEIKRAFPVVSDSSRDEALQYMILDYVDRSLPSEF